MSKRSKKNVLVGLDIGTSKVVALVGILTPENKIEVIGMGSQPSQGLKRGVVVNIDATVQSIQRAVEEAEMMANCDVHYAFAGIAGSHIQGLNSHGVVAIRNAEVTQDDVERVIEAAKAVAIPADQKVLHILPHEFVIDYQDGITEPLGMSGVRLEAKVHMITGSLNASQNIATCMQRCGLDVSDVVSEQLASSYSVLMDDERTAGVCLIDIGAGTTDLAIFTRGGVCHTATIAIAGDQVTSDISYAMRVPTQLAEEMKRSYACALTSMIGPTEAIQIPGAVDRAPRKIPRRALAEVVQARYEELFLLIQQEIRRSGFEDAVAAGVVITGGGSKIPGVIELAEAIFKMPARIGVPTQHVAGLTAQLVDPMYATSIGLLIYARQQRLENPNARLNSGLDAKGLWRRTTNWFRGNF